MAFTPVSKYSGFCIKPLQCRTVPVAAKVSTATCAGNFTLGSLDTAASAVLIPKPVSFWSTRKCIPSLRTELGLARRRQRGPTCGKEAGFLSLPNLSLNSLVLVFSSMPSSAASANCLGAFTHCGFRRRPGCRPLCVSPDGAQQTECVRRAAARHHCTSNQPTKERQSAAGHRTPLQTFSSPLGQGVNGFHKREWFPSRQTGASV